MAGDAEVPALCRGLLRKNKLDEIACLRWSSFARLGQRITGRSHGNELDAFNVHAAKSRRVHVQLTSHADASMAVSDHTRIYWTAKGLRDTLRCEKQSTNHTNRQQDVERDAGSEVPAAARRCSCFGGVREQLGPKKSDLASRSDKHPPRIPHTAEKRKR